MALIFIASSDPESGPRGSRLIGPLIRWLVPDITPTNFEFTVLVVRKGVHFGTYAVLSALLWRALAATWQGTGWGAHAGWAFAVAVAYAISDEIHQSFVPTRVGSAMDVGIDAAGAAFALGCIGIAGRLRWRR